MLLKRTLFVAILAILAGGTLMAQNFKYIGAPKCKMCHNKPPKGEQYNKWMEGPHANALESLKTDQAKQIASSKGLGDPMEAQECLKCHSTVAQVNDESLLAGIKMEEGVSCESCHGPGSRYKGAAVMRNRQLAMQNGLILPTAEVCKKCHNEESPTYKGFNYEEYKAEIDHDDPTTDN